MGAAERRRREREKRRGSILAAAERVFLGRGLAAATMDQIAAEAEVSKGTLYLYFKSKDDLYLAIAVGTLRLLVERMEAAAKRGATGVERVRSLARAQSAFARENQDRFRVSVSWTTTEYSIDGEGESFREYRALIARIYQAAVGAISVGQRDGTIRSDMKASQLALQLWGGMLGTLLVESRADEVSRRIPGVTRARDMVSGYIDVMVDGIRPRRRFGAPEERAP